MARAQFEDDCVGCLPVVVDPETNTVLPDSHPVMVGVNDGWAASTLEERQAFHRVTCLNARGAADLLTCRGLLAKMGL